MKSKLMVILILFSIFENVIQNVALSDVYKSANFVLFYTPPIAQDQLLPAATNKSANNGISDFIQNTANKLESANSKYTGQEFNLQSPLQSNRYQGRVNYFGIYIEKLKTWNGLAGDEIVYDQYKNPILKIVISDALAKSNLTPEHELFHTFQSGYSMFKNRWYTEGTASWVENAFRKISEIERNLYEKKLPANSQEFENLVHLSYEAEYFWTRLTFLCDPSSPANDASSQTKSVYGVKLIKTFLENLKDESDLAAQDRCRQLYDWPEEEQKFNTDNNVYIFKALKQAVLTQCPAEQLKSTELSSFIREIDNQLTIFKEKNAYYDSNRQQLYLPNVLVSNAPSNEISAYKVILDYQSGTVPAQFALNNSTPICDTSTVPVSATFDSMTGVLMIPYLKVNTLETYKVYLSMVNDAFLFNLASIENVKSKVDPIVKTIFSKR